MVDGRLGRRYENHLVGGRLGRCYIGVVVDGGSGQWHINHICNWQIRAVVYEAWR